MLQSPRRSLATETRLAPEHPDNATPCDLYLLSGFSKHSESSRTHFKSSIEDDSSFQGSKAFPAPPPPSTPVLPDSPQSHFLVLSTWGSRHHLSAEGMRHSSTMQRLFQAVQTYITIQPTLSGGPRQVVTVVKPAVPLPSSLGKDRLQGSMSWSGVTGRSSAVKLWINYNS